MSAPSDSSVLIGAMHWASRGLPVHPLIGKRPVVTDWPNRATTDPPSIRKLFADHPEATNVGIATGRRIVGVDIDPRAGGWEHLLELETSAGEMLPRSTLNWITGGDPCGGERGRHFILRAPAGVRSFRPAEGVEVKGAGGNLVAPPSVHPETGRMYERGSNPHAAILDAPPWLLALATPLPLPSVGAAREPLAGGDTDYGRAALIDEQATIEATAKGNRNNQLRASSFKLGQLVGAGYLSLNVVRSAITDSALASGYERNGAGTGLAVGHARTIESGLRDGSRQPRAVRPLEFPPTREPGVGRDVRGDALSTGEAEPCEWGEPVPLAIAVPSFPVGALPDWLRDWVTAQAEATQTPPDLAAMTALGVIAGALARRVGVQARPGWNEPANLWIAVIQRSGERKSAVHRDALEPVHTVEQRLLREAEPRIREAAERAGLAEERAKRARRRAVDDDDAAGETEAAALSARQAAEEARAMVPERPRLLADDLTPEALGNVLATHGRIIIASDEGGIFETFGGRYASNGAPNLDILLKAHAGESARVDRMSRPTLYLDQPAATLVLAAQPDVLVGLGGKSAFRERGLTARLLYAVPSSRVGRRKSVRMPVPNDVARTYRDRITALFGLAQHVEGDRERPRLIPLTDDARRALDTWRDTHEPQLAGDGRLVGVAEWANKLPGAVLRIALALHFAEHGIAGTGDRISVATIEGAIRIGEYLVPHAIAAHAYLDQTRPHADARLLLDQILNAEWRSFTERQAFNGSRRLRDMGRVRGALAVLADHGWIRVAPALRVDGARGRPSSLRWEVNPAAETAQVHSAVSAEGAGTNAAGSKT